MKRWILSLLPMIALLFTGCSPLSLKPKEVSLNVRIDPQNPKEMALPLKVETSLMMAGPGEIAEIHGAFKYQKILEEHGTLFKTEGAPHSLWLIRFIREGTKENYDVDFPYFFTGKEEMPLKLRFEPETGVGYLNDDPIFLLLKKEGLPPNLKEMAPGIRSLILSGDAKRDTEALRFFEGTGISITIPTRYRQEGRKELRTAILKCRPSALFAHTDVGLEEIYGKLPGLTHLFLASERVPDPANLKNLRFLALYGPSGAKEKQISLSPLIRLKHLRTLFVGNFETVTGLEDLARSDRLTALTLQNIETVKGGLQNVGKMTSLKGLSIEEMNIPSDLTFLAPLKGLEYLVLYDGMSVEFDPRPLESLPNLTALVVDKSLLEDHEKEFDALRKSKPKLEIVGLCMGSGWLAVALGLSVAAGLLLRRLRNHRSLRAG